MGRHTHYYRIANLLTQKRVALTASEIGAATGSAPSIVSAHIRTLHNNEQAHIEDWRLVNPRNGKWAALWKYGPGVDAPKPVGRTAKPKKAPRVVQIADTPPGVTPTVGEVIRPTMSKVARRRNACTIQVPESAFKTIFAGGVNPWAPQQTAQKAQ